MENHEVEMDMQKITTSWKRYLNLMDLEPWVFRTYNTLNERWSQDGPDMTQDGAR